MREERRRASVRVRGSTAHLVSDFRATDKIFPSPGDPLEPSHLDPATKDLREGEPG
jgi:hypothetical protein